MSSVMKLEEIRGKDSRELRLDLQALNQELFKLRFHESADEVSETSRFRDVKKTVARIHTILRERDIAAAADAPSKDEASTN